MKKYYLRATLLILSMVMLLSACGNKPAETEAAESDELYQVSLLDALMKGYYDGVITISELEQNGDTGIGTFDRLAGEMIMLDGVTYQAKVDGTVVEKKEGTTPFACVKNFHEDIVVEDISGINDIEELKSLLNSAVEENTGNFNCFYMTKVSGDFAKIKVRSVPEQEKPYRPLSEVAAEQKEYEYSNVKGTLVALYCPEYISGINLAGWHIHFISEDFSKGGHVLELCLTQGSASVDLTNDYSIVLPEGNDFSDMSFGDDMTKETEAVEKDHE